MWIQDDSRTPPRPVSQWSRPTSDYIPPRQTLQGNQRNGLFSLFKLLQLTVLVGVGYVTGHFVSQRPYQQHLSRLQLEIQQLEINQDRLKNGNAMIDKDQKRLNDRLSEQFVLLHQDLMQTENQVKETKEEADAGRTSQAQLDEIVRLFDRLKGTVDGSFGANTVASASFRTNEAYNFFLSLAYDTYGTQHKRLVEFNVRIWKGDRTFENGSFVVELAPFEQMPVSTLFFLEQVKHGIWDGTSFYANMNNSRLMAHPISGNNKVNKLHELEASGLARVPVTESYHEAQEEFEGDSDLWTFRDAEFALGFASALDDEEYTNRGVGSSFFVQRLNRNDSVNGRWKDINNCFAKVVEGRDVIERIMALEADESYRIQPVDIVSASVMQA